MNNICIDTETYYSEDCTVKTLGNYNYVRHPDWDCYMVSVAGDNDLRYVGPPEQAPWDKIFTKDSRLISHNTGFDKAVIERLHEQGIIPKPEYAVWEDTADLAAFLGVPRNLKGASKALLGVEMSKDVRDNMKAKRYQELPAEKQKEVLDYALGDAVNTLAIWNGFSEQWPEEERWLSRHTRAMGESGLPLDREALEAGIAELEGRIDKALSAVPWYEDTGKVLSRSLLEEECAKHGLKVPKSLAKDDEECIAWENQWGDKYPFIGAIRDFRRCNMLYEKLVAMKNRMKPDGCSLLSLKYFGGHCVTAGHEVLTKEGWVPIEKWNGGEIAQWDQGNQTIEFKKASANRFINTEPLVTIDAPYVKGEFTAGHTLPYLAHGSFAPMSMKAAEAVTKKSFYAPTGGIFMGQGAITADQIRLLVAVQADGHWTCDGILQFCLRKHRKMSRLRELLDKLGIPFREKVFQSCQKQTRFSVARAACPEWLSPARKTFGAWLLDSTPDARRAFVEEVTLWDGHRGPHVCEYYSGLKINVEWVGTLAHLAGMSVGRVSERKGGNYSIRVRKKARSLVYADHVTVSPCRGEPVFCPTTITGYWVYRFKGAVGITGNTGRWSGDGGVNYQNLPRGDLFGVNLRKLIKAPPGKTFVIVDLSQIEARVTLWFAKDKTTLDMVAKGVDLYEAHARATMGYSDPMVLKDYDKKHGTAHRQMAKVRVLGLGFGCGAEKFVQVARIMGGVNLSLEESQEVVTSYRQSNRSIVGLWRTLENHVSIHANTGTAATFQLPSGRDMHYREVMRVGKTLSALVCQGGTFFRKSLWGGSLTENCLSGDSEVLSEVRGWVRLDSVTPADKLWDGVEFVSHGGLLDKGRQETVSVHGVRATKDHLFLTNGGWLPAEKACTTTICEVASQDEEVQQTIRAAKAGRDTSRTDDYHETGGEPYSENSMGGAVSLRALLDESRNRADKIPAWDPPSSGGLRAPVPSSEGPSREDSLHPRHEQSSGVLCVAFNERQVSSPDASGVEKLRWERNNGVRTVAGVLRGVLEGHGADVEARASYRPDRQRVRLLSAKLPLGASEGEPQKQEVEPASGRVADLLPGHHGRSETAAEYSILENTQGVVVGEDVVFDVLNCGPRHRFVVRSPGGGVPLIAHNCVQAASRDILAYYVRKLADRGFDVRLHVHDEVVLLCDESEAQDVLKETISIMSTPPEWIPDLPVAAEGEISNIYKK